MRPGSDVEHTVALIRTRGYHMPEGMMYVRLVHLLDEQQRKELMIIYGEDVAQSSLLQTFSRKAKHTVGGRLSKRAYLKGQKRA